MLHLSMNIINSNDKRIEGILASHTWESKITLSRVFLLAPDDVKAWVSTNRLDLETEF